MFRPLLLRAALLLLVIWGVAMGIRWGAGLMKPTPAKVQRYVEEHPVANLPPAERGQVLEKLARQMSQLSFEQRRQDSLRKKVEAFFAQLTPEEKGRFLDLTLPSGMKQMMEAFNAMPSAKRKQFVDRALRDMRKEGEQGLPQGDEAVYREKMIAHGLRSFYSDASAETKLDFSPLLEQMQRNLQGLP